MLNALNYNKDCTVNVRTTLERLEHKISIRDVKVEGTESLRHDTTGCTSFYLCILRKMYSPKKHTVLHL